MPLASAAVRPGDAERRLSPVVPLTVPHGSAKGICASRTSEESRILMTRHRSSVNQVLNEVCAATKAAAL